MHIVLLANDTTFVYNLRREVIEALIQAGNKVTVASKILSFERELNELGADLANVTIMRRRTNIWQDLVLLKSYFRLLKGLKPDLVLSNNIKPNCYGGLVCQLLGIRYIPNITGLGTAVENAGLLQKITTHLYRAGIRGAACVLFQNTDNICFFREKKILSPKTRIRLLPGSGVNLDAHPLKEFPRAETIHFLYVSRVLREKGIDQYLAAAKAIRSAYPQTMFHICGACDDTAYWAILKEAEKEDIVVYHGEQKDMLPFFEQTQCVVHPSYYPEGMSNVLLEAAACGRPVITTDRVGCRETVDDGISGFIVPAKDEQALIKAINRFIQMRWEDRRAMGLAGRRKMEREFDRRLVVQAYLEEIERAVPGEVCNASCTD